MNTQELLNEIRELKSQYHIGSFRAFKCLKARRWIEEVLLEIRTRHRQIFEKHNLTLGQVCWLVLTAQIVLSRMLQGVSARISTPTCCSLGSDHEVAPLDLHPYRGASVGEQTRIWSVKFPEVLSGFLNIVHPGISDEEVRLMLFSFLSQAFQNGRLAVQYVQTGEEVTYREFCRNLKYRGGSEENAWIWSDTLINCNLGDELITDEQRNMLRQALRRRDLPSAHPILQAAEIRRLADLFIVGAGEWSENSLAADDWLYDENLYERAEREYTLGYTTIERQILLNEIRKWESEAYTCPPDVFVSMLTAHLRSDITERERKIRTLRSSNELFHYKRKLRKKRYLFTALQQNRPWLI